MQHYARPIEAGDAIDWFAEALRQYPDREDELKAALRGQLGERERPTHSTQRSQTDEPDELWDNVPV